MESLYPPPLSLKVNKTVSRVLAFVLPRHTRHVLNCAHLIAKRGTYSSLRSITNPKAVTWKEYTRPHTYTYVRAGKRIIRSTILIRFLQLSSSSPNNPAIDARGEPRRLPRTSRGGKQGCRGKQCPAAGARYGAH